MSADLPCKRCGRDCGDLFNQWGGLCESCHQRDLDDSKCRKCKADLPQGRPTGSICQNCKDMLLTETLRSQLTIMSQPTRAVVTIRKTGCSATLEIPASEFQRRERFQGLDFMRALHKELGEAEEREERESAERCTAMSPWPRCAVHNPEGRAWILSLIEKHNEQWPDQIEAPKHWTCSCQW